MHTWIFYMLAAVYYQQIANKMMTGLFFQRDLQMDPGTVSNNVTNQCVWNFIDSNGMQHAKHFPDDLGIWQTSWVPPGKDAVNYTLEISCLDSTGLDVKEDLSLRAREGVADEIDENNTGQSTETESESFSNTVIVTIVLMIVIIIIMGTLLIRRPEEEFVEDETSLPEEAWSRTAGEISDDILLEMAGLSGEDSVPISDQPPSVDGWTDEELIASGWTQRQIDAYREEE